MHWLDSDNRCRLTFCSAAAIQVQIASGVTKLVAMSALRAMPQDAVPKKLIDGLLAQ